MATPLASDILHKAFLHLKALFHNRSDIRIDVDSAHGEVIRYQIVFSSTPFLIADRKPGVRIPYLQKVVS